jgi:hypothetical protein
MGQQAPRAHLREEGLVAPELLASLLDDVVVGRNPDCAPIDIGMRIGLERVQDETPGVAQTGLEGALGDFEVGCGARHVGLPEVQRVLVVDDAFPRHLPAHGVEDVGHGRPVVAEEQQGVPVRTRSPTLYGNCLR